MDRQEIIDKIKEIISDVTEIPLDEISTSNSLMDDLDLSSLEIMTIVADIEKEFKLTIPERVLRTFDTVEDLADYLEK